MNISIFNIDVYIEKYLKIYIYINIRKLKLLEIEIWLIILNRLKKRKKKIKNKYIWIIWSYSINNNDFKKLTIIDLNNMSSIGQ